MTIPFPDDGFDLGLCRSEMEGTPSVPWELFATLKEGSMYAIAFDLDTAALREHYPGASPNNGYAAIGNFLRRYGFSRQQGSVYFGDASVTPVGAVLAVQDMARHLPWLAPSVRDIRMLRIEENNDLNPAISDQALGRVVADVAEGAMG